MADIETTNSTVTDTTVTEAQQTEQTVDTQETESAELARLRSELAKQKQAFDKASKEAADFKKQLRAKQTAEEIAAEDMKAQKEANDKELNELRKKFAVMETSRSVMSRIGGDEAVASQIADYLYGAADVDGALTEIQKIFTAREKALRLEFSKVPAPGAGASDAPALTQEQLNAMNYRQRLDFANKYPEEYRKLMGR